LFTVPSFPEHLDQLVVDLRWRWVYIGEVQVADFFNSEGRWHIVVVVVHGTGVDVEVGRNDEIPWVLFPSFITV
jgi:hypothetical protein